MREYAYLRKECIQCHIQNSEINITIMKNYPKFTIVRKFI